MIKSAAKISIDKTNQAVVVSIYPNTKPWQQAILFSWVLVWFICGIFILINTLSLAQREEKLFMVVFLSFWAYFLFLAIRVFMWNQWGGEFIRLKDGVLDYKRSWRGYGRAYHYDLKTIKKLGLIEHKSNLFAKSYQEVFWTIGGETIGFEYIGKKIAIGRKLSLEQAKEILASVFK